MKLRQLQQQLQASRSLHAIRHLELDHARHELALARDEAGRHADSLATIRRQRDAIVTAQQQSQTVGGSLVPEQMTRLSRQHRAAVDLMADRQAALDLATADQGAKEAAVTSQQAAVNALHDRCLSQRRACAQERDRLESLMLEDLWLGQHVREGHAHADI